MTKSFSNKFYYKNIFLYSSLQFTGNFEDYFVMHTEKLVAFVLMPRQQYDASLIRLYVKGKLKEEKKVILSKNIFIYYLLWYFYQILFLIRYFSRKEKVVVITFHPISFFGMMFQKLLRNIEFVYWIADYFPPVKLSLILFERLKRYYNGKLKFVCYLSDLINEKINKKIINSVDKKTVMWGILPKNLKRTLNKGNFTALFVGVIRESQGLEFIFEFLKSHRDYSVKIVGVCEEKLYKKYKNIIKDNKIEGQVYFPNKFLLDEDLEELSKTCQVGIAVYNVDETSATYYTDPGKIKTYAALGLPIIMSDISAIAPYVEKFRCGKVIKKSTEELGEALSEIKNNYDKYLRGLKEFNKYFFYNTYYKNAFKFLEKYE